MPLPILPAATAGPFRIAGPQTSPRRKFGDGIVPQTPAAGRGRRTAGFRLPERRHPGKYLGRPSEKHSYVPVACRSRTSDGTDRRRGRPRPIRPAYCAAFRDFEPSPAASSGRRNRFRSASSRGPDRPKPADTGHRTRKMPLFSRPSTADRGLRTGGPSEGLRRDRHVRPSRRPGIPGPSAAGTQQRVPAVKQAPSSGPVGRDGLKTKYLCGIRNC